jgi:hypothetical protein
MSANLIARKIHRRSRVARAGEWTVAGYSPSARVVVAGRITNARTIIRRWTRMGCWWTTDVHSKRNAKNKLLWPRLPGIRRTVLEIATRGVGGWPAADCYAGARPHPLCQPLLPFMARNKHSGAAENGAMNSGRIEKASNRRPLPPRRTNGCSPGCLRTGS